MDRREFLHDTSRLAAGSWVAVHAASSARRAEAAPNDRVAVCVAGVRGRGGSLLRTFAALPSVDVTYVCDVDRNVLDRQVKAVAELTGKTPRGIVDYHEALKDPNVDALVLGTPDHWHALPTIHACQAGKDVYVEKPDGHDVLESRTMAAAARKYGRVVQLGTQARSGEHLHKLMEYLAQGRLGRPVFAKAWESSRQGSIGHPADLPQPPEGVDYDRWLGPAPKRPFNPVRFHGHWRWFFDYGTGDLGNDGVHRLDIARWALETAVTAGGGRLPPWPQTVVACGGKYYFDDDQQWPDTLMVTYDYGAHLLTYEMRIWSAYPLHEESEGAAVYGDEGYVIVGNGRWRAFDSRGRLVHEQRAGSSDAAHAQNFIDCMHSRAKPAADLETVGHISSMLCHLGNCAWRAGRLLRFDPSSGTFVDDPEANRFLTRPEYRAPYLLPAIGEL
jgi:predicted dehydrogenase